MTTLESRIKEVLDENPQIVQTDLASISGASRSVVNQWIDSKIKSMRLDYALEIERALGYSHIWLVLGTGEKKVRKHASFSELNGSEAQLLMFYRQLTEHKKHELEAIANRLANEDKYTATKANPYLGQRDEFGGVIIGSGSNLQKAKRKA